MSEKKRKSFTFDMSNEKEALAYTILMEKGKNAATSFLTEAVLMAEGIRLEKIRSMLGTSMPVFTNQQPIEESKMVEKADVPPSITESLEKLPVEPLKKTPMEPLENELGEAEEGEPEHEEDAFDGFSKANYDALLSLR